MEINPVNPKNHINPGLFLFFHLPFLFQGFMFCAKTTAQNADQTFAFAEKQYKEGNYSSAIAAFQRIIFFDEGEKRAEAFHRLGECYFQTGEYGEAAINYGFAYHSEKKDSLKNELIFKTTQSYLLLYDYHAALAELFNLPDNLPGHFGKKKNFYFAISYWGLEDFALSEKYFSACLVENKSAVNSIRQKFQELNKVRINPRTAEVLSMILPGAGQLYAGDYKNAFNSLVINAALFGLYLYVMHTYSFVDALISVFPWFQRYYTGGVKKSGIIAAKKINERRTWTYDALLDIVSSASEFR